jgi:tricorn protease
MLRFLRAVSIIIMLATLFVGITAHADDSALGMLFPAISPDGSQIAFSYQGDIWVVAVKGGIARRLTISIAFDRSPCWSPEGKTILFSSQRDGNYDLYTIPAVGGDVKRLTYSDSEDYAADWSPDGKRVLFTTYRSFLGSSVMELDVETGKEKTILQDSGTIRYPRYSPDGSLIAFNRGGSSYTRLGYKGAGNSQVWVMGADGKGARRLDEWNGGQYWPNWSADGKHIYYLTDRGDDRAVYSATLNGGEPIESLRMKDKEFYYLSVAPDGDAVVWADGQLFTAKLSPAKSGSDAKLISISAGSDAKQQYVTREVFSRADEVEPSPDGKWLALIIRGDVYIQPLSRTAEQEVDAPRGGEALNFTNTAGREQSVQWMPESDKLILLSDKDGDENIYLLDLNTKEWTRLTNTNDIEINPRLSPDGKQLAFYRGTSSLIVLDLETKREQELAHGSFRRGVWSMPLEWSPDSKWLAFSDYTTGWDEDLFVIKVDGREKPHNITQYPTGNWGPIWTSDGKNMLFSSARGNDIYQLYLLPLKLPELKFTDEMKFGKPKDDAPKDGTAAATEGDGEAASEKPAPSAEKPAAKGDDKKAPPVTEIDFTDIEYRAKAISETLGGVNNYVVSPDGKTCIYESSTTLNEKKLWAIDLLTGESGSVPIPASFRWMTWNAGGAFGVYEDGRVVKITAAGSQVQGITGVPITAHTVLDRPAELLAMYDEAYRNLKYGFYDPKLHGRDMDAAYRKYRKMIANSVTHEEFDIFTTFLLGELNASHLGVYGESSFQGIGAATGKLGVTYETGYEGPGWKVARVLPMGPAARDESRLVPGDVILAVDGTEVGCDEVSFTTLDGKAGNTVHLKVRHADGTEADVRIRPITRVEQSGLEYEMWVRDNRAMVEKISGGRIGYVHIESMDDPSLERFKRELFGYAMKFDGLVIDVRYNGGGHIHERLFELLGRRPFGYSTRRDSGKLIQPGEMYQGVKVCLTNEYSFSDAEIFPYGFRQLGYGKLVGMPTNGGVIGTSDYQLIDGTTFRIPQTGWYTMGMANLENNPTVPDYIVDIAPGVMATGDDPQLRKAVEVIMGQLQSK